MWLLCVGTHINSYTEHLPACGMSLLESRSLCLKSDAGTVWFRLKTTIWILCCQEDKRIPAYFHMWNHCIPTWLQFYNHTHTHTHGNAYAERELIAYFCRVRLRLPVQLLILFWASRWFMASVAMPPMDRTMSPTAMPPLAAFPPSVSCKHKKHKQLESLTASLAVKHSCGRESQGEVQVRSVFISIYGSIFVRETFTWSQL